MPNNQSPNLFFIDDDEIDILAIKRALKKKNIKNPIFDAKDGQEAWNKLNGIDATPIPTPYIIFLDLNMPKMNGIELLKKIRNTDKFKKIIIFIMTTSDNQRDKDQVYNLNVAGYIIKNSHSGNFDKIAEMIRLYSEIVSMP